VRTGVIVTTAGVRECAGLPAARRHAGRGGLAEGPYCHSERATVDARIEEALDCRLGRGTWQWTLLPEALFM